MAKKSRTPPPPRKVQVPQRRVERREPRLPADRRQLYWIGGLGGAGLVAVIVVLVVLAGGGGGVDVAKAMTAAGCTYRAVPATGAADHIRRPTQKVDYKTVPPAFGRHHPTPAVWGDYSQPVDPRQAVHNLEHGGVVVWYSPAISGEQRVAISNFYNESPNAMLITPYDKVAKGKIALTAWTATFDGGVLKDQRGQIAVCPAFDEEAFDAFRNAFRGKGPERVPVALNRPGT